MEVGGNGSISLGDTNRNSKSRWRKHMNVCGAVLPSRVLSWRDPLKDSSWKQVPCRNIRRGDVEGSSHTVN